MAAFTRDRRFFSFPVSLLFSHSIDSAEREKKTRPTRTLSPCFLSLSPSLCPQKYTQAATIPPHDFAAADEEDDDMAVDLVGQAAAAPAAAAAPRPVQQRVVAPAGALLMSEFCFHLRVLSSFVVAREGRLWCPFAYPEMRKKESKGENQLPEQAQLDCFDFGSVVVDVEG